MKFHEHDVILERVDENLLFDLVKSGQFVGELPLPARSLHLDNPLCGDEVTFFVELDKDNSIKELRFKTRGCFICRASAAVVAHRSNNRAAQDVITELESFRVKFLAGSTFDNESEEIKQLIQMRNYPTRVKCVLLPFETLKKLLLGSTA